MKRTILGTTAMLTLAATLAFAGPIDDQVVAGLQAQGFDRIEVKTGPTQIKIEAIRGTTKVELVYDAATGALLSQETGRIEAGDDISVGVDYSTDDEDYVDDDGDESDDDGADDESDDDESDDDESDDAGGTDEDNGGDDESVDDDRDDDRDDDNGRDDDRDDDRGGDDNEGGNGGDENDD